MHGTRREVLEAVFPEIKRADIDLVGIGEKLQARAEQLKAELGDPGSAQAKSKIGELRFNVHPKGAEILVDGVSLGTAPIDSPVFVDPGPVEVTAKLEGYTGVNAKRDVAAVICAWINCNSAWLSSTMELVPAL